MAAPLITAITTVPNRENATNQASFSNDTDTFFSQVGDFQTQANVQAEFVNTRANDANSSASASAASALQSSGYASTAIDARDAAIASAAYKGTWEGKTSAGVVGESYSYQGSYIYRLNVNLANISTSTPSPTNPHWQLINVVPFQAPCKPTLKLDFANQDFEIYSKQEGFVKKPLADIVTQGRSTAGTSTDAIGGITEFAAGQNRFEFDGETGEAKGYLSEETRTNLLRYSEDFSNPVWIKQTVGTATPVAITPNFATAPDGTMTADRLEFNLNGGNSAGDICGINQQTSGNIQGQPAIHTIWLKTADNTTKQVELSFAGVMPNIPNYDNSILNVTGKWQRFVIGVYSQTNALNNFFLWLRGGRGTSDSADLLVWGAERYQNVTFPTSYIKTLDSTVTRSADAMTRTLGQEWNPNEGTFVVELFNESIDDIFEGDTALGRRFILSNGASNRILFAASPLGVLRYGFFNGLGLIYAPPNSIKIGRQKIAVSITKTSGLVSVDGGAVVANSSMNNTAILSQSIVRIKETLSGLQMDNTIKSLEYYPRAFDALTLQRLSRID